MMIYFTGHEKENDLAEGIYTTEYRLYDARVGRWLSVDPLFEKYVGMSPYNYCMLNPVMLVDPDGRAVYGIDNGDGSASYAVVDNNASSEHINFYKDQGYQFIDDSYDVTFEDGTYKAVPKPKDQKYGEYFTGMTDNPLNWGTSENGRSGDGATDHGESGVTSLLQTVKFIINGVDNLWRSNSGKNDEKPISNNSSQNNTAKDNYKIKSDTVVKKSYRVRNGKPRDPNDSWSFDQYTDTIVEIYVNGKRAKSDTLEYRR